VYRHDRSASALAWQQLLDRARAGRVPDAARRVIRARLALAEHLDALYETDRAIEQLEAVLGADAGVASRVDLARAQWQLGVAYDRLGQRQRAVDAYTLALDQTPSNDATQRGRIREAMRRAPDAKARDAYRLSLEGWRAFERGALEAAATALTRAIDLDPLDDIARYRFARVLTARGDPIRAKEQLERLIRAHLAPAFVLASAYVAYAQLLERDGDRLRAIENYRSAADLVGGDTRARDDARAALKRLGAG
jgi:tetratricopeptide (TPR) repeat protein